MLNTKVAQVCSATKFWLKYNYHLNLADNELAIDLGLQNVKKYKRCRAQIADKLNHLQDFLFTLAIFVNNACVNYNKKM